ncbi:hypothetical protein C7382_101180 [Porphyromonas loveana]|uniref:Uncharacterized protein n=1 Tax=Porphyromonas loveana TaxID=1884669 RepID=A0A2U1FSV4_9PORP|nr:hypothetical protein C7382_101180 [Porphyromonas loveana]
MHSKFFIDITPKQLAMIEQKLNNRTPFERFFLNLN